MNRNGITVLLLIATLSLAAAGEEALAQGMTPEFTPGVADGDERPTVQISRALAAPDSVEMTVTGLSCPFCAFGLEKKLKTLEGLDEIHIEAATGTVRFGLPEGHELTEEKLRSLVQDAGFEVQEIARAPWIDDPGTAGR